MGRGRPKGSKNKKKPEIKEEATEAEADNKDCCEDSEQKLEEPIAA